VRSLNHPLVEGFCAAGKLADPHLAADALVCGVLGWGGIEKVRPIWQELITSFRIQLDVEMLIEEDHVVAARYTERGVFSAPLRGAEPTGKSYEIVAMEWFDFREALIIRRWGARDSTAMFRQMGIPLE